MTSFFNGPRVIIDDSMPRRPERFNIEAGEYAPGFPHRMLFIFYDDCSSHSRVGGRPGSAGALSGGSRTVPLRATCTAMSGEHRRRNAPGCAQSGLRKLRKPRTDTVGKPENWGAWGQGTHAETENRVATAAPESPHAHRSTGRTTTDGGAENSGDASTGNPPPR